VEDCLAPNHPQRPELDRRAMPFSRELWIERDDYQENPPKGYFRLAPGAEVRLRFAYIVRCVGAEKDAAGNVVAVHCTYDPATRSGTPGADARKVKGNIHWLSAAHALPAEVRLYGPLFTRPDPEAERERSYLEFLAPNSLQRLRAWVEPSLAAAGPDDRFQFERQGYFCADADARPDELVFNRVVTLRDSFAKG
jgi:glutaminyl-tRNA synthetase